MMFEFLGNIVCSTLQPIADAEITYKKKKEEALRKLIKEELENDK